MPRIERTAQVTWEGNVARGNGGMTAGSGAFAGLPYSLPARIGRVEGKTSPEELLAAAHAGCLTMGIATELTQAGTPPERLEVSCRIVMDEVEGRGHLIVGSHVTVPRELPEELVERADAGCPFSIMLRSAGVEVTISRA
ncbi:MAG TPA: OsmC family peroxiredoxin [Gaiellaceae bacterium]|jgi:osmotically inducible protein OsmC|nr:OsmC family peroxiredoxin [Gaiellaceae bacterium]